MNAPTRYHLKVAVIGTKQIEHLDTVDPERVAAMLRRCGFAPSDFDITLYGEQQATNASRTMTARLVSRVADIDTQTPHDSAGAYCQERRITVSEVARVTGKPRRTILNWYAAAPALFEAVVRGVLSMRDEAERIRLHADKAARGSKRSG